MFFDNGDFLIFTPPDLSVALFLDTAYDKEAYDRKSWSPMLRTATAGVM